MWLASKGDLDKNMTRSQPKFVMIGPLEIINALMPNHAAFPGQRVAMKKAKPGAESVPPPRLLKDTPMHSALC